MIKKFSNLLFLVVAKMRGSYTKAQFNKIKCVEKNIDKLCQSDATVIGYDASTVLSEKIPGTWEYSLSYNDIGTLLFVLFFGKDKITILNMLLDELFANFFPFPRNKGTPYHKLYHLMKKNIFLQLNMNKLLTCINPHNRIYFYDYVKLYYANGLAYMVEYIDMFQKSRESLRNISSARKYIANLTSFENIANRLVSILNNVDEIETVSCRVLDVFFKTNIRYYDSIPSHIFGILDKIYNHHLVVNIENDGMILERAVIDLIDDNALVSDVVKPNAYFIDDRGVPVNNKKSEFDIVIGALDYQRNVFKIKTIYDIKRSARLIQEDIDKFKSAVESDNIILKNVCGQHMLRTEKTNNFSYGYLYVNEWSTQKETAYKVRDLLIALARECNCYKGFFMFMCNMIKIGGDRNVYLHFNTNFAKRLARLIVRDNDILQKKLSNVRLRYINYH